MQAFLTLARRELGGYFFSPIGYVILASSTFLMGFSFVVLMVNLQQDTTPMPITELFYNTYFFWLILLLATPVITMRTFALEKFSGTFETLMTTPVGDLVVVLAKFAAALFFYTLMWLPLLACILVVRHFSSDRTAIDLGVVGSTFLGIFLLGCLFIAAGCCASAITRSQVTAAMITLLFGASLFLLGVLAKHVPVRTTWQTDLLSAFSLFDQMDDFARGLVDTRPILLLLSLAFFFLFLTLRIIESRRWR